MALDASIYNNIQQPRPVNMLADYANLMQLQGAQQANKLNQLKFDAYQREQDDNNALRSALSAPGADPYNALLRMGRVKEATEYRKSETDAKRAQVGADKDAFDLAKNRYGMYQQTLGSLAQEPNLSKDLVLQAGQGLVQQGILPAALFEQAAASLPDDPVQLRAKLTQSIKTQLSPEQMLTMFAPKPTEQDNGQVKRFVDTNPNSPTYGQTTAGAAVQKVASPDAQLSAQTSTANNQRSVGAQYAIADATRAAALTEKQLKIGEMQDKAAERQRQREAGIASIGAQIGVIDKALTHPGRETSTGLSGTLNPTNYVPGTDAADFRSVLDQIGGAAFLQAFESLKGGGQITEVEGKKATDAMARLSRAQSDKEFEQSLRELREVMAAGYKRQAGREFDRPAPTTGGKPKEAAAAGVARVSSDAEYNALPSGAVFVGPDGKQRRKP